MSHIYIQPHLGLGDAIIINGLIRHFCSKYDTITLFCMDRYCESIRWMLRDIKNLNYHKVSFHNWNQDIQSYLTSNNAQDKVIKVGFEELARLCDTGVPFYDAFYLMHNLEPRFRFNNFYYHRDLEIENYVSQKLNPNNEKYIFVIDDFAHHLGGFKIPDERLSNTTKIIRYDKSLNYEDNRFLMFNYYKLLEGAEEIHTIETAFFEFIRSTEIDKSKVYVHSYLRSYIPSPIEGYNFIQK